MNKELGIKNGEVKTSLEVKGEKKFDFDERLIDFAVLIINISENAFETRAANHITGQMLRSGTSPSLNYGEAQSAESRNDFIHKLKILTKELKETLNALKIMRRVPLTKQLDMVDKGIVECNELISIFMKSIQTAKSNNN